MTEPELEPFLARAREVVARYPDVTPYNIDGLPHARWADTDGFVIRLTNKRDHIRGVWIEQHTTMDQFELDLIAACDKLTELSKETEE